MAAIALDVPIITVQDAVLDEAAWQARRARLNEQYERSLAEGLRNFKFPLPADASEQDILDYAVEITRRR